MASLRSFHLESTGYVHSGLLVPTAKILSSLTDADISHRQHPPHY